MRRLLHIFASVLLVLALAGCDVHEVPWGEPYVDVTVKVSFDDELPLYRELDYKTKAGEESDRKMRHIVRVFRANGVDKYSLTPDFEKVIYTDGVQDFTVDMRLEPVDYKLMVWSDYADAKGKGVYYNADDFAGVKINGGEYKGSDACRDAFRGVQNLELSTILEMSAHVDATVDMSRPVAKYSIVANDKSDFIKMFIARLNERYKQSGTPRPEDIRPESIKMEIFKVVVVYGGFLPDTYSLWTDRPVDARTGVSFNSKLREMESGELELAFDYVIVNGEESSVNVSIFIYDDLGDILSTIHTDIPLHVGMRTVLKGKYLTSGAASGISINPGYDGEFNINI